MSLETDILQDPAASYWLKEQIRTTSDRDMVDALYDAITLVEVLRERKDNHEANFKRLLAGQASSADLWPPGTPPHSLNDFERKQDE